MTQEQPRVLFVRGCPRSGTTLLADVMNENPDIGLLVEMPFGDLTRRMLGVLWYEDNVTRERNAIAQAGKRVAEATSPSETGPYFIPLDNLHRVSYARRYPTRELFPAIVTAVVEASLEKPNLKIIGSKTPGRWDEFEHDVVRSVFAEVRYVFVVRNPLDTVNSIVNRRNAGRAGLDVWPYQEVGEAIGAYFESTSALLSCTAAYPDQTYVVRYEDLTAHPSETLRGLGNFLGVDIRDRTSLIEKVGPSKSILSPNEEADVRAAFGPAIATWERKTLTGPGTIVADQLDDCVRVLEPGKEYRFDVAARDRSLLGSGWSAFETQGVWSEARQADLHFRVPQDGQYTLTMELGGYVPTPPEALPFGLRFGEHQVFAGTLADSRVVRLRWGPADYSAANAKPLRFVFPILRSPAERGFGTDCRKLGVCLRSLLLERSE